MVHWAHGASGALEQYSYLVGSCIAERKDVSVEPMSDCYGEDEANRECSINNVRMHIKLLANCLTNTIRAHIKYLVMKQ